MYYKCLIFILLLCGKIFSADNALESEKPISVHLMWIKNGGLSLDDKTKSCDDEEKWGDYIFPNAQSETVLTAIEGWKNLSPQMPINFWYEKKMVSEEEIQATKKLFEEKRLNSHVILRDIGSLRFYSQYNFVYGLESLEKSNILENYVYYKADFTRFLLARYCLMENPESHFLYAAMNVSPISLSSLQEKNTRTLIDTYGYLNLRHRFEDYGAGGCLGFENGFLYAENNPFFLEAIEKIFIQPFQYFFKEILPTLKSKPVSLCDKVYGTIPLFSLYILHSQEKIYIKNSETIFSVPEMARKLSKPMNPSGFCSRNMTIYSNKTEKTLLSIDDFLMATLMYYYNDEDLQHMEIKKKKANDIICKLKNFLIERKDSVENITQKDFDNFFELKEFLEEKMRRDKIITIEKLEKYLLKIEGIVENIEMIEQLNQHFYQIKQDFPFLIPALRIKCPISHFSLAAIDKISLAI